MKTWPHVAVVILSWNGKDFLEKFLPSVTKTNYPNCKIWVADNASTDDSVQFIKEKFPQVGIIQNPRNDGFAGGYNMALENLNADYFVLLNQDVAVEEDWLLGPIKMLESDSQLAIVQPKVRAEFQPRSFEYAGAAGGFIDRFGIPFCRGRLFQKLEIDEGQYNQSTEIFWAGGCGLFIRAQLFKDFGGLDERFFAHMEEIDLCWRVKNAGYKIAYCPDSTIYHVGGGSLPKTSPRKAYLNFRNNLFMLFKNLKTWELFCFLPLRMAIDGFVSLQELAQGKPKHFWAIFKSHLHFYASLPWLFKARKKTRRLKEKLAVAQANSNGRYPGLILIPYLLGRKKKFSDLKKF